ncbi:MAG: HD domain-containing protein [Bacillus sp. (in: Bacteria)]|nr:HD domain-containing protein [Bacillus sp. (in: firmicutes)]MCM1426221.1 HD domain-containing protein [Eubacterium sp.]
MTKDTYQLLEDYMNVCMEGITHDKQHVYRVLYTALDIAQTEPDVDYDVLIAACLLHDIGRKDQSTEFLPPHAETGASDAYRFLLDNHFSEEFSKHVSDCIRSHSFRAGILPQSKEAEILFDADKIDVSGAIGIARTLMYKGEHSEPLYTVLPNGEISKGLKDTKPSFFQEYKSKLELIYTGFFTERAKEIAKKRRSAATSFYRSMLREARSTHQNGNQILNELLDDTDIQNHQE